MDFRLSDEQKLVRQTVRDFVRKELIPLEGEVLRNEREGRLGIERAQLRELQLKAKEIGFWGINTPEEYGGADLGPIMTAIIMMELARTFVPFSFGGSADNILYYCNEEQKARYLLPTINGELRSCFALTEPGAGSDAANIQMSAVKDGEHWILNGEKIFITNGNEADFAMVFAVTDKAKGGHGGVTCFLVDREMGWRSQYIHTMGEWGPASLYFENVRVPEKNILGELNRGFQLGMQWIGAGRWAIAARAVGASERLLQMAIDHARTRKTFGKAIAERQAIQWMIADSHVEIEATRWLMLHAAWLAEQGQGTRHAASMAKLFGSNMANRVADRVLQIHGGMGYTKELPIERWYREMRVWRIFEGTDEIQRFIISRDLLRGYVKIGEEL
ncbi:acyl-CoA dehydrogenase [Ktedonosporobacter rubrisoli]|uniref:Medium-chain specific acyl-CoA dehydrogenase, mitochondrial n=1 Tax=Ktedonosporobacter rubrisoli TaxID=2509675 RepID=A0A4P6JI69_KTERU|nr:acyl-CoA dehydrogenase family protein [Ktedonosporobacter rubrisoli]QBD74747.1 acyl-CoA dehydrogenase [Ktedonosporobacter rubrisoli]